MSEAWHGITLAEIRTAYFHGIENTLYTIRRLIDSDTNTDYTFNTDTNGAVIVTNNYLTWEFISPKNYTVSPGSTVADFFTNLESAVSSSPVSAWDDFAVFLSGKASTINMFIQDGDSATVTDAQGNTYAGTAHQVPAFSDFSDFVTWMRSWFGSDALAAASSVMFESSDTAAFRLTYVGETIQCSLKF